LVVTDQPLANLIALTLNHGVYTTLCVTSVRAARVELERWRPHLLIVDIDPERSENLELLGQRVANRRIPTIACSGRGDLKTTLAAFEHGADDILTIPFSPEEMVARVLALMRRTYGETIPFIPIITVAGLEIDLLNQRVQVGSSQPSLTTIEQSLLYLLASNPGQTLGREEILDALWGPDYVAESNVIDRHIRNLRAKLEDDWRHPKYIATVPGHGYRFLASG
jgi:two-component system KDP operon response regulator KdpE